MHRSVNARKPAWHLTRHVHCSTYYTLRVGRIAHGYCPRELVSWSFICYDTHECGRHNTVTLYHYVPRPWGTANSCSQVQPVGFPGTDALGSSPSTVDSRRPSCRRSHTDERKRHNGISGIRAPEARGSSSETTLGMSNFSLSAQKQTTC